MSIKLLRVDDRFIHAQVIWGWVPIVKPTQIIVANDDVAHDELRRKLLTAAAPDDLIVKILSLEETVTDLRHDEENKEKTILVVSKPADVVFLVENGISVESVSFGWMSFIPGRRAIFKTLYMGGEDIQALRKLISMGVDVKYQASPSDVQLDAKCWMLDAEY